jgi:hypothetical protein
MMIIILHARHISCAHVTLYMNRAYEDVSWAADQIAPHTTYTSVLNLASRNISSGEELFVSYSEDDEWFTARGMSLASGPVSPSSASSAPSTEDSAVATDANMGDTKTTTASSEGSPTSPEVLHYRPVEELRSIGHCITQVRNHDIIIRKRIHVYALHQT